MIRTLNVCFDILVIDDNSPDGTGTLADQLAQNDRALFVMHRPRKLGLGTAYIQGFRHALKNDYEYVLGMDADLSHDPNDLPRLFSEVERGADLAVGSRYINGVRVNNWSFNRLLLSKCANGYANFVLRTRIKDLTTGFRCYRAAALRRIDFSDIKTRGYGFFIEMTYAFFRKGFCIKEVPIIFSGRENDVSKMSNGIKFEAFFSVIRMRLIK